MELTTPDLTGIASALDNNWPDHIDHPNTELNLVVLLCMLRIIRMDRCGQQGLICN